MNKQSDFSKKYDHIADNALEELLRADFDAPPDRQLPSEEALYIAGLLAKRRGVTHRDTEEALAEFWEVYYPLELTGESLYDFGDEDDADNNEDEAAPRAISGGKPFLYGFWRSFAAMAAALVLLVCCGTVSAYAKPPIIEIQNLASAGSSAQEVPVTARLIEIMAETGEEGWVPKWLPEGYKFANADLHSDYTGPYGSVCTRCFRNQNGHEQEITLIYRVYFEKSLTWIKSFQDKGFGFIDVYNYRGTDYYILGQDCRRTIVWDYNGEYCSVAGPLTMAEAHRIIASIYE